MSVSKLFVRTVEGIAILAACGVFGYCWVRGASMVARDCIREFVG